MNYPVGDFLIRIKNAARTKTRRVEFMRTKFVESVAKILKEEGILKDVEVEKGKVIVNLAYTKKEPVLLNIKLVSKPGLRVYMTYLELKSIKGPQIYIISTSKGVLTSGSAIKKRLGGEVIAEVL